MRKLVLIAGAAALAASMPAIAEKGGKGGGNGGGGGKPAAAQGHGGGGGHGGGKAAKAHGGGHGGGQAQAQRFERRSFGGGKPDKAERQMARGGGKPDKAVRHATRDFKAERKAVKNEVKREQRFVEQRSGDRRLDDRRFDDRRFDDGRDLRDGGFARFASSCPPGLAKKNNGCLPPGQAKKAFGLGQRIQPSYYGAYNVPQEYRAFYRDTGDYFYRYDNDDGYIYRIDSGSNLISGLVPLLGGGFAVGQPLPTGYDVYNVPQQYRDTYYDTDDSYYRYGDDAIYRVDPQSGIIESIVALLAGDLNVGQALPSGYDAYNLPLDYRDQYQDNADYNYRYADGNIYQVDTKTQIIQAIVEMLV